MKGINIAHIRIFILIFALSMIVVGVVMGEHLSVFQKSIRICLECIGIG